MRTILSPDVDARAFLQRAVPTGYSMQAGLLVPRIGHMVSRELEEAGLLVDYTELEETSSLKTSGLQIAHILHERINELVSLIEGEEKNHLPFFSVRVFKPGRHGTTIHRNDPSVGPWAIGITLKGEAPFNVYHQSQLPIDEVIPLYGDSSDPIPLDSMDATAGSAWTLYTRNNQVPHSSGLVHSNFQRELLIFYGVSANS